MSRSNTESLFDDRVCRLDLPQCLLCTGEPEVTVCVRMRTYGDETAVDHGLDLVPLQWLGSRLGRDRFDHLR